MTQPMHEATIHAEPEVLREEADASDRFEHVVADKLTFLGKHLLRGVA